MDFITSGAIPADVILGNPNMDCAGHGICKVTTPHLVADCPCLSTRAWLKNNTKAQRLVFCFSKVLLPIAIQETYFKGNYFLVEEELKINLGLLGLDNEVVLLNKGCYNILNSRDQESLIVSIAYRIHTPIRYTLAIKQGSEDVLSIN